MVFVRKRNEAAVESGPMSVAEIEKQVLALSEEERHNSPLGFSKTNARSCRAPWTMAKKTRLSRPK
jgi:hypothetical protein